MLLIHIIPFCNFSEGKSKKAERKSLVGQKNFLTSAFFLLPFPAAPELLQLLTSHFVSAFLTS
jgi:hypothetical protein